MNTMKMSSLASAALFVLAAAAPIPATAAGLVFNLDGPGVSGLLNLTYESNPNTGVLPGTAPNPVDPIGSYVITGVTGTFSDVSLGLSNVAITGVVAQSRLARANQPAGAEQLQPASRRERRAVSGRPLTGSAL